jgi:hypothetical protein
MFEGQSLCGPEGYMPTDLFYILLDIFTMALLSQAFTTTSPFIYTSGKPQEEHMRVKEILSGYKLCVVDLEVQLAGKTRNAPTLCVSDGKEVIPLNTADGRPILMNKANAIPLD